MIIRGSLKSYLKGELFSSAFEVEIDKIKIPPVRRERCVAEMIAGKKVIHVGCADHLDLIETKRRQGLWLHGLLMESASKCIGVDINKEGIDYLKEILGINDVFCVDIIKEPIPVIESEKWDFLILGEIIEHLDNPVEFLKRIHEAYSDNIENFIVTVPSVYSKRRWKEVLNYKEVINTDHRFWFTPFTISKVLFSAGLEPEEVKFANLCKLTFPQRLLRRIKRLAGIEITYPFYFFNDLVITGRL